MRVAEGNRALTGAVLVFAIMAVVFVGVSLSSEEASSSTLNKQSGMKNNDIAKNSDIYLIVHGDDLGMSHSVNVAAIRAFKAGLMTSGSIMVPCPWFSEIAQFAREHPEADLGLHMTLTSEWKHYRWGPVAPREQVPSLVDSAGYLWRSVEEFAAHADPEQVRIELRAQIRRALDFGISPTHLDSHMGALFAQAKYLRVFYEVAAAFGIPPLLLEPNEQTLALARRMGLDLNLALVAKMKAAGFPALDRLITEVPGNDRKSRQKAYHHVVGELTPGVTEIIIHPGTQNAELGAITSLSWKRDQDVEVFTSKAMTDLIEGAGIKTTTWRALHARLR